MIKKLFFTLIVLCFSLNSFSQERGIKKLLNRIRYSDYNYRGDKPMFRQNVDLKDFNFGYYFGAYQLNYKLYYNQDLGGKSSLGTDPAYNVKEIIFEPQTGFGVGFISELRLANFIDLRFEPGYLYGRTNIDFNSIQVNSALQGKDVILQLKQSMLYLPLLIKLSSARYDNFRPFVVAGISKSIRLGAKNDEVRQSVIDLRSNINQLEVGIGIDLYLPYFKFTPAIRAIYGRENELLLDNDENHWSREIVEGVARRGLKNRGVFFVLTFE
ncbi:MAG: porin family protein [Flavobacteriaceae bacterium]